MFNSFAKQVAQQADKLTKEASVMANKYGKEAKNKMNAAMGKEQLVTIGTRQLRVGDLLGEGGYAFVYKAEDMETGAIFALKRMLMQDEENIGLADLEIDIMKKLAGKAFVIQLLGSTKRKIDQPRATEYFVLMELCTGGSLMDLITRRHKEKFKEPQLCSIFYQIVVAVSHLHKMKPPVAHRDLKIENVLIGGDGEMRLCDFGSCTTRAQAYLTKDEMTQEEERIQKYSTSMYRAPEMVDLYRKDVINEKVDIWALGCILYTLAFFVQPFQEGGNLQIIGGNYTIPEDHRFSKMVPALIKKLLTMSPKKRPDVHKVLELMQKWIKALKKEGHTVDIPKPKKAAKKKKADDEDEDDDSDEEEDSDDEEEDGEDGQAKGKKKPTMNTDFGDDFATDFNAHSPTSASSSTSSGGFHNSQSYPSSFPTPASAPNSAYVQSPTIPPVNRAVSNPPSAKPAAVFDMSAFADSLIAPTSGQPAAPAPQPAARAASPSLAPPPAAGPRLSPPPVTTPRSSAGQSSTASVPSGFDFFGGSPPPASNPLSAAKLPSPVTSPKPGKPAAGKPAAAANGAPKKKLVAVMRKKEQSSSEDSDSDEEDSDDSGDDDGEDSDSDDGGAKKKSVLRPAAKKPLSKK